MLVPNNAKMSVGLPCTLKASQCGLRTLQSCDWIAFRQRRTAQRKGDREVLCRLTSPDGPRPELKSPHHVRNVDVHTLYRSYYSQAAYQNTFLVNDPREIAQAIGNDKEWNNIKNSGCHFTCLAMIAGIDPASFASALARPERATSKYFSADRDLPARDLSGADCYLVWDQNHPSKSGASVRTNEVWHAALVNNVVIDIGCVGTYKPRSIKAALKKVVDALARGNHVVCGPDWHSVLVAGLGSSGPFIWDPDRESEDPTLMIAGQLTLVDYAESLKEAPLILHEYSCTVSIPARRGSRGGKMSKSTRRAS